MFATTLLALALIPAADPKPRLDPDGLPLPAEAVRRFGSAKFSDGPHSWASFSPDGKTVVTVLTTNGLGADRGRTGVVAWEVSSGKRLWAALDGQFCRKAAVHTDGKSVWVFAGETQYGKGHLHRLSMADGGETEKHPVNETQVTDSELHPDGWLALVEFDPRQKPPRILVFDGGRKVLGYTNDADERFEHVRLAADRRTVVVTGYGRRKPPAAGQKDDGNFGLPKRLMAVAVETGKTLWTDETGAKTSVVLSADAKRVFALDPKPLRLRAWDVATGREGDGLEVKDVTPQDSFGFGRLVLTRNPDGKTLYLRRTDGGTLPVDATTLKAGEPVAFPYPAAWFSPDGKVAARSRGRNLELSDAATGRPLPQSPAPLPSLYQQHMAFSPSGDRILRTVGNSEHVTWDTNTGREVDRIPWKTVVADGVAGQPSFQAGTDVPAVRSADSKHTLRFGHGKDFKDGPGFELTTDGTTKRVLDLPQGTVMYHQMLFTPDARFAMTANYANQMFLWDLHGAGKPAVIQIAARGQDNATTAGTLFPSPDSRTLAVAEKNPRYEFQPAGWQIGLYDLATRNRGREFTGKGLLCGVNWSADGTRLGGGGQVRVEKALKGFAFVSDTTTGRELMRPVDLPDPVLATALSPDGQTLAVGAAGRVVLYEVRSGHPRHTFQQSERDVLALAFHPDGKHLLAEAADGSIFLWDVRGDLTKPAKPDSAGWGKAWDALGGEDAAKAFQAIRLFALHSDDGTAELKKRFAERKGPSEAAVAALVAKLGDADFQTRERATKELRELGHSAFPALKKALADNPPEELRARAERLLAATTSPDGRRAERAVEAMQLANTEAARKLLADWAKGPADDVLTKAAKGR